MYAWQLGQRRAPILASRSSRASTRRARRSSSARCATRSRRPDRRRARSTSPAARAGSPSGCWTGARARSSASTSASRACDARELVRDYLGIDAERSDVRDRRRARAHRGGAGQLRRRAVPRAHLPRRAPDGRPAPCPRADARPVRHREPDRARRDARALRLRRARGVRGDRRGPRGPPRGRPGDQPAGLAGRRAVVLPEPRGVAADDDGRGLRRRQQRGAAATGTTPTSTPAIGRCSSRGPADYRSAAVGIPATPIIPGPR